MKPVEYGNEELVRVLLLVTGQLMRKRPDGMKKLVRNERLPFPPEELREKNIKLARQTDVLSLLSHLAIRRIVPA